MKRAFILLCIAALAACGGGGGGGTTLPVQTPPSPVRGGSAPPSPSPSPTGAPSPTAAPATAAVQLSATLPINDEHNYLSSPLIFGVRLRSVNGASASTVTTQQTTCATRTCTFTVTAPTGNDVFAVTYAAVLPQAAGTSNAPLSYAGNVTANVSNTGPNSASTTLLGVPAYYELDLTNSTSWTGTMPLVLHFIDASNSCTPSQVINGCSVGSFIGGTLANPVTVTDSDASGQSGLALNGAAPKNVVTITRASDTLALVITSAATISQAYVTPSGTFSAAVFGNSFASQILTPWATQDTNGLGFTCNAGACQATGPANVTIQ